MPARFRLRLLLAVGLAPYKMVKKFALTSILAGRFSNHFAWLVAYAKYLLRRPSNALPCLASSLAISCTVSWIASRLAALALLARSVLPAVPPFPANWDKVYASWKAGEITAKKAMELTDTKRTSFYKLVSLMDEE